MVDHVFLSRRAREEMASAARCSNPVVAAARRKHAWDLRKRAAAMAAFDPWE
jgi:hypothetical protein